MKKNKKVVIICAIIVAIIVISLIFALVYKGKTGKLPFEKTEDEINTVKMVENSTIKVTLGEVATTDDYMIIEYEVDIKDKNIDLNLWLFNSITAYISWRLSMCSNKKHKEEIIEFLKLNYFVVYKKLLTEQKEVIYE